VRHSAGAPSTPGVKVGGSSGLAEHPAMGPHAGRTPAGRVWWPRRRPLGPTRVRLVAAMRPPHLGDGGGPSWVTGSGEGAQQCSGDDGEDVANANRRAARLAPTTEPLPGGIGCLTATSCRSPGTAGTPTSSPREQSRIWPRRGLTVRRGTRIARVCGGCCRDRSVRCRRQPCARTVWGVRPLRDRTLADTPRRLTHLP
jgi:hypothetical protein